MDEQGYVSQFSDLNLGIAAQTEAGLIVPVLKKAQTLSIWQMADEITPEVVSSSLTLTTILCSFELWLAVGFPLIHKLIIRLFSLA